MLHAYTVPLNIYTYQHLTSEIVCIYNTGDFYSLCGLMVNAVLPKVPVAHGKAAGKPLGV